MTTPLPPLRCDCCNLKDAVGVAASPFGPVSYAYCVDCLQKPADPLPSFLYLFEYLTDRGEDVAEWDSGYFTFIAGEYVSWTDFVQRRRDDPTYGDKSI